jgi:S1-C subfamily serine protease
MNMINKAYSKKKENLRIGTAFGALAIVMLCFIAPAPSSRASAKAKGESLQKQLSKSESSSAAAALTPDEAVNVRVYKSCNRGVVNISCITEHDIMYRIVPQQGMGSGSIISADGYIMTNFHVVEKASDIQVTLWDGTTLHGTSVGQDPSNDLAVIKIDPPANKPLTVIPFGDSSSLEVGRRVFAIGNPFGYDRSMTTGIVSSLARTLKTENNRVIKGVIQTDANINPGNSGGPLLDTSGHMIAITTAIFTRNGNYTGIGLAIPINIAKRIIPELIAHHFISRPDIGIQGVATGNGLRVVFVEPEGPGAQAGISGPKTVLYQIPNGLTFKVTDASLADVITNIDNVAVRNEDDLLSYIESKKVGEVVTLTIVRNKKVLKIPVKLATTSPT